MTRLTGLSLALLAFVAEQVSVATEPIPQAPETWISTQDYPQFFVRPDPWPEGDVTVVLTVSEAGRAVDCKVTESSNYQLLDYLTCKFLLRRARFVPAKNEQGTFIEGSYETTIGWQIPD